MRRSLILVPAVLIAAQTTGASAATRPPDRWASEYAGGGNASFNAGERLITTANARRVRPAWHATNGGSFVAPAVVNGTIYRVVNAANAADAGRFVASSARTGARRWSVQLPAANQYLRGQSISGHIAVLPFEGRFHRGGVTAVDLSRHRVLWSRSRPPSHTDSDNSDGTGGPIDVDAGRVYLIAGNNHLSAYAIKTGALLWHRDPASSIRGITAAAGRVFAAGYPSTAGPGLVAYDGRTGRHLWSAPALRGWPVVSGRYVVSAAGQGVGAVPVAGCGKAICALRWSRPLPDAEVDGILIGGATSKTMYASIARLDGKGRLVRLSSRTGAVIWSASLSHPGAVPIRGADMVWLNVNGTAIQGWSTRYRRTAPLRTFALPADSQGIVSGLAAAGGTLLASIWAGSLLAYRVAGT